jgi:flagellar hook-associated protein 1 FlgK
VDAQIDTDLITVNDILKNLAELNQAIGKAETVKPYSAVDLRDQRQAKLEELSKYFDVSISNIPDGNGQIEVTARGADGSPVVLVSGPEVPNDATVSIADGKFSFGGVEMDFSRGGLGGQLQARNGDVQNVRTQISNLATQLKSSVNTAYGRTFFSTTPTTGIPVNVDSTITVSALSATLTSNQGANEAALAVARLANQVFSTKAATPDQIDGTFIASFNSTVSQLGQSLNTTNIRLEDQELSQEMAISNRDQYSGVSQDEEMTDLMKFQRSFQASARHINVLDTLLEQVVNRLGVG